MSIRKIRPMILATIALVLVCIAAVGFLHAEPLTAETPTIEYSVAVQGADWQAAGENGKVTGTEEQAISVEAFQATLENHSRLNGSIKYRAYRQETGWEKSWKKDGDVSGTTGENQRMEAIRMKLTDDMAQAYDLYYCVKVQELGWLAWAKNGEKAGTEGYDYAIEGMKVILVKKGDEAPEALGTNENSVECKTSISYHVSVQSDSWQVPVSNGETAGASCVEALEVTSFSAKEDGDIEYRGYIQNTGWEEEWSKSGSAAGTNGQSLRMEAIQMKLTGDMAEKYDIYYCVTVQNFEWLAWAKNGEDAGSTGCGFPIEGVKVMLVKKGDPAPENYGTNVYSSSTCVTLEQYQEQQRKEEAARIEAEKKAEEERKAAMATSAGRGRAVVSFARQFIGNPYVYGGSSLTNGTDCSGFTMSVMRNFGVSLPHGSNSQRAYGTRVASLAEAQPGDLVFFRAHVGIYTGNGMMVHASQPGVGIVETPVRNSGTVVEIRRYV